MVAHPKDSSPRQTEQRSGMGIALLSWKTRAAPIHMDDGSTHAAVAKAVTELEKEGLNDSSCLASTCLGLAGPLRGCFW